MATTLIVTARPLPPTSRRSRNYSIQRPTVTHKHERPQWPAAAPAQTAATPDDAAGVGLVCRLVRAGALVEDGTPFRQGSGGIATGHRERQVWCPPAGGSHGDYEVKFAICWRFTVQRQHWPLYSRELFACRQRNCRLDNIAVCIDLPVRLGLQVKMVVGISALAAALPANAESTH